MRYVALNGFRHPLDRYFNENVECLDVFNWTYENAMRYAFHKIKEPTTLIGFSDGATAALTIARLNAYVKVVYAHSPMYRDELLTPKARIHLFRTQGDTTPTYGQTWQVFESLTCSSGKVHVTLQDLHPGPFEPIRDLATMVMWFKGHQFRNCLPHLPLEILKHA
jgi:predicted esterase